MVNLHRAGGPCPHAAHRTGSRRWQALAGVRVRSASQHAAPFDHLDLTAEVRRSEAVSGTAWRTSKAVQSERVTSDFAASVTV